MSNSHLDDPRYDPTAMDLHLARDLPVAVNGTELRDISDCVEDALDWLMKLPDEAALNELICATSEATARKRGMIPIFSATATAGPLTSTGFPLERWPAVRSTTVTSTPCCASQNATVAPAMPAPQIRTVLLMRTPLGKRTIFVHLP